MLVFIVRRIELRSPHTISFSALWCLTTRGVIGKKFKGALGYVGDNARLPLISLTVRLGSMRAWSAYF
jgi:hypothetical protein